MLSGCPIQFHLWCGKLHMAGSARPVLGCRVRGRPDGCLMTAQIIYADFKSRTYHKPETLEQMAVAILEPFTETTGFTETVPFGGAGIDGMTFTDKDPA